MMRASWWQRRKARRADRELLEEIVLKERFLGPIDPQTGRRPVDASAITVGRIDASLIRAASASLPS